MKKPKVQTPAPDPAAEEAKRKAEELAARQAEEAAAQLSADQRAFSMNLRGRRALLSGGDAGYPNTLGGI